MFRPKSLDNGHIDSGQWRRPRRDLSSTRKAKGNKSLKKKKKDNSVSTESRSDRVKRRVLESIVQSLAMSKQAQFPERRWSVGLQTVNEGTSEY